MQYISISRADIFSSLELMQAPCSASLCNLDSMPQEAHTPLRLSEKGSKWSTWPHPSLDSRTLSRLLFFRRGSTLHIGDRQCKLAFALAPLSPLGMLATVNWACHYFFAQGRTFLWLNFLLLRQRPRVFFGTCTSVLQPVERNVKVAVDVGLYTPTSIDIDIEL